MPFIMSPKGRRFLRLSSFVEEMAASARTIETRAAKVATEESRLIFNRWHSGRPIAPSRKGRKSTEGRFASLIEWQADAYGMIRLDRETLQEAAPYWIIQEIGTGQSALSLYPEEEFAVPSQIGRQLPMGFYWGNAGGTNPTGNVSMSRRNIPAPFASPGRRMHPGGAIVGQQQLYPAYMAPPGELILARGRIRREIKGKHFIRDGGIAGYDLLRERLLADFGKTFK